MTENVASEQPTHFSPDNRKFLKDSDPSSDPPSDSSDTKEQNSKPSSNNLEDVVSTVVDNVVDDVAMTTALNHEKAKVQRLINGLMSRVKDDAAANSKSSGSVTENSHTSNGHASSAEGVPANDYRLRQLSDVPVEWTQTRYSVTLNVRMPPWVRKRHVRVKFDARAVDVCIDSENHKNDPVLVLQRPLSNAVDEDGCMWALEGDAQTSTLLLELEKSSAVWWPRLFETDDPSSYTVVNALSNSDAPLIGSAPNKPDAESSHSQSSVIDAVSSAVDEMTSAAAAATLAAAAVSRSLPNGHSKDREPSSDTVVEDGTDEEDVIDAITPSAAPSTGPRLRKVLTKDDLPKLVEQYTQTVERGGPGSSEAAIQLASFYHYGVGVKQNDARAVELYKKGLEGGTKDAAAAFQLGLIYNSGAEGVPVDSNAAFKWWLIAARMGSAVAMYNIGVLLMNGIGCDMDPEGALVWFKQALALDPKLEMPRISRLEMESRIAKASKLKRERMRKDISPEERTRRKEEALQTVRYIGYTTLGITILGISAVGLRYWWRNRL